MKSLKCNAVNQTCFYDCRYQFAEHENGFFQHSCIDDDESLSKDLKINGIAVVYVSTE